MSAAAQKVIADDDEVDYDFNAIKHTLAEEIAADPAKVDADLVRMCPELSKRVKILASQKRIIYAPTNSFYQVLSGSGIPSV